jgi:isopentenyl-diphosphate delta-isomerase
MRKSDPFRARESADRYLIQVDRNGHPLRIEEKEKCHEGCGIWHSAFLVMIFDEQRCLMEARRSPAKRLWPNYWDGTVASHFIPAENQETSIKRRIFEELGLACDAVEFLFKFPYRSRYKNIGIEKEVCHIFKADRIKREAVSLNKDEVTEFRFSGIEDLASRINSAGEEFTPWFLLAFEKFLGKAY